VSPLMAVCFAVYLLVTFFVDRKDRPARACLPLRRPVSKSARGDHYVPFSIISIGSKGVPVCLFLIVPLLTPAGEP